MKFEKKKKPRPYLVNFPPEIWEKIVKVKRKSGIPYIDIILKVIDEGL